MNFSQSQNPQEQLKQDLVQFMTRTGLVSSQCRELMQLLLNSANTSSMQNSSPKQFMMDVVIRFFMNLSIEHIGMLSVCLIEKFTEGQIKQRVNQQGPSEQSDGKSSFKTNVPNMKKPVPGLRLTELRKSISPQRKVALTTRNAYPNKLSSPSQVSPTVKALKRPITSAGPTFNSPRKSLKVASRINYPQQTAAVASPRLPLTKQPIKRLGTRRPTVDYTSKTSPMRIKEVIASKRRESVLKLPQKQGFKYHKFSPKSSPKTMQVNQGFNSPARLKYQTATKIPSIRNSPSRVITSSDTVKETINQPIQQNAFDFHN